MTPEKAFKLYIATRLHFTSNYDVFQAKGHFSWESKICKRKDFSLINNLLKRVSNERELIELCVSNFLYGNTDFLYNDGYIDDTWSHWKKVKESISFFLERDLNHIELSLLKSDMDLDDYFENKVISDVLSNKIEYESIIMLNRKIPVIDMIGGFDSTKYKVRMHKANMFVTKGVLAHTQSSLIDTFLSNNYYKENTNGNISI